MGIIDEALRVYEATASDYDPGRGKQPEIKIAIVTCGDPRVGNIEQMLGLAPGDVAMFRNFGTVIDDDTVRSLVLATRLLGAREIMIINHTDCGMLRFTDGEMRERLRKDTGQAPIAPARFYSFTDTGRTHVCPIMLGTPRTKAPAGERHARLGADTRFPCAQRWAGVERTQSDRRFAGHHRVAASR
jgi:carbonic anhydrase